MNAGSTRGPKKKIVRVTEEYGLEGIGEEMAEKWVDTNSEDRHTLEDLRDLFNKRVLKTAMKQSGAEVVPGEIEYTYEYLFDESVAPSEKEDTRHRLEEKGVDVEKVQNDFIGSPQTIHNYLRQVEQVELNPDTDDKTEKEKTLTHIKSLERRYETIVDNILSRLIKKGEISQSEYIIDVDCTVKNVETGEEQYVEDLLEE